jgi:nitric oxide dioxygenase
MSTLPSTTMPLTDQQKELIKASVPALKEHGGEVTKIFYDQLIEDNPQLKDVFNYTNQVNQHQPRALAGAVYAYAANIDNLGALGGAVDLICNKHASLFIQPEQYALVGKYLLAAMKQVLGDALTPELLEAWTVAYGDLANIFIQKEASLYKHAKGWTDWKEFRIAKKVQESKVITSFYLEPVDERVKPLPPFLPGQVSVSHGALSSVPNSIG